MKPLFTKQIILMAAACMLTACASGPAEAHRGLHPAGVTVKVLPAAHRTVVVGKVRYYSHGGVYYRPHSGGYRVVAAPVGLRVATLPAGFVTINLKSGRYFRHGTTYYRAGKRGFVVVTRPRGVRIVG